MEIRKTNGEEFYRSDGTFYVGEYYLKNNVAYVYNPKSKFKERLIPSFKYNTEFVRQRSTVKGGYKAPVPYVPSPEDYDYSVGKINRYFMQKRVFPKNSILEVSQETYQGYGASESRNAVNSKIYNATFISWAISGNLDYVRNYNKRQIEEVVKNFPGLDWYLINHQEFYKD